MSDDRLDLGSDTRPSNLGPLATAARPPPPAPLSTEHQLL